MFSHGHLYVGLSRTGDPRNVHIYADQEEFENFDLNQDKKYTRNVVFPEIFD